MQVTPLQDFKAKLAHSSSAPLRILLAQLFVNVSRAGSRFTRSELIQNALRSFEESARGYESWGNCTDAEVESSSEALESLVCRKAYQELFHEEAFDQERDSELQLAYDRYSEFIRPRHLELIPELCQESDVQVAVMQLRKLNAYVTPRDKLVCISNCYRVVSQIIQAADCDFGADVTLPLFTYVVLKSRTPFLYRNYYFIKSFRSKFRREARDPVEFRYILTTLKITLNFITELSMDKLKLDIGENVPVFRSEMTTTAVQTEAIDITRPAVSEYSGPLEETHLRTNLEDLKKVLEEYISLRDCYKRRIAA